MKSKILFNCSIITEHDDFNAESTDSYRNSSILCSRIFNGDFGKNEANMLKMQVKSRHISRKVYEFLIKYRPNSVGVSDTLEYICDCAHINRNVGCCSQIVAVVYYLSHARY